MWYTQKAKKEGRKQGKKKEKQQTNKKKKVSKQKWKKESITRKDGLSKEEEEKMLTLCLIDFSDQNNL